MYSVFPLNCCQVFVPRFLRFLRCLWNLWALNWDILWHIEYRILGYTPHDSRILATSFFLAKKHSCRWLRLCLEGHGVRKPPAIFHAICNNVGKTMQQTTHLGMAIILPIKMVITGGWSMTLSYPHPFIFPTKSLNHPFLFCNVEFRLLK